VPVRLSSHVRRAVIVYYYLCIHNHANTYDGLSHLHLKVIPCPISSSTARLYLVHYLVQRHDIVRHVSSGVCVTMPKLAHKLYCVYIVLMNVRNVVPLNKIVYKV
jgi:hypothetical protein